MAKKSKKSVAQAMQADKYVEKRYAPRVTFTDKDIKGLKDMKVGDTHDITIKAKLVAIRKDEYGWDDEQDRPLEGTFKIELVDNKSITTHYDDDEDD